MVDLVMQAEFGWKDEPSFRQINLPIEIAYLV